MSYTPTPAQRWATLFNEFSLHVGYKLAQIFYRGIYSAQVLHYHIQRWKGIEGDHPVLQQPSLHAQRPWNKFWSEFSEFLLKNTNRIIGRYVLPIIETVAKWQIASWLVVSMVSAGFSLPFIGLQPMLILAAGISLGLGYHQYCKIVEEEEQQEAHEQNKIQIETIHQRIDSLERILAQTHNTTPPALRHYPTFVSNRSTRQIKNESDKDCTSSNSKRNSIN